jgi:hypothetical protein
VTSKCRAFGFRAIPDARGLVSQIRLVQYFLDVPQLIRPFLKVASRDWATGEIIETAAPIWMAPAFRAGLDA